jgi:prephenate dehydratase
MFVQRCLDIGRENRLMVPMVTLTHILESIEDGSVDFGCVPVENSLEGSVAEVLDSLALRLNKTRIAGEFVRPIRHSLIRRLEFLKGIAFIHSHPQAIGQCREAIHELLGPDVKFVPASSTSEAVKSLLTLDETHAALGSAKAAQHYNLEVLIENIGNLNQNATRFLILTANGAAKYLDNPKISSLQPPIKTSMCVGLNENRPGALLEILTLLARYQLNMTKIESRPTKKCLGEYLFYLDVEGTIPPDVLALIEAETSFLKTLGVYPALGVFE